MKIPLFKKLIFIFYLVLLLFTGILSGVFLLLFREQTFEVHQIHMVEQAQAIAEYIGRYNTNRRGIMRMYGLFLQQIAVADVWLVDRQFNIQQISGSAPLEAGTISEPMNRLIEQVVTGTVPYGVLLSDVFNVPTQTAAVPVFNSSGTVTGAVLLHAPVSGINKSLHQTAIALAVGAAVAAVIATVAAYILSRQVTRPLFKIADTVHALEAGHYDHRCNIPPGDEISTLAENIDRLAIRLEAARQEQASLDRMRENFVATISHELRTPVAVLKGSVEVLKDGIITVPHEIDAYYRQMYRETVYLERLVNDLLELSRLQDDRFRLEKDIVSVHQIIQDAARAIRQVARKKNITLQVICTEEDYRIQADYSRIRQVLIILLDNAVKFSRPEQTVQLELSRDSQQIIITVTDYGSGIRAEELPHIFDRFHKASTGSNHDGTGLGLAIARQIISRHGGTITAESTGNTTDAPAADSAQKQPEQPDRYTRFTVRLPAALPPVSVPEGPCHKKCVNGRD